MKEQFGHFGDVFQALKEIYDSLPKNVSQRTTVKDFTLRLASFRGEWPNLDANWPEVVDDGNPGYYNGVSTAGMTGLQE